MYCSYDEVKRYAKEMISEGSADDFTDPNILLFSNEQSVPVIDGALAGLGAPFATAPALIKMVDAMLTAGAMMSYIYRRNGDKRTSGERLTDDGMRLLMKIKNGELSAGGSSVVPGPLYTVEGDDLPDQAIFVGRSGVLWRERDERRGS